MLVICDWKTTKGAACYDEYKWQVSAYIFAYAIECMRMNKPYAEVGLICAFDKETGEFKTYNVSKADSANGMKIFEHCRHIYSLMNLKPSRFYGDESNPSVTTVLDILNKPALIQWAANSVNDFWQEHLPEIRNPDTSDLRIEQIIKSGKMAHRRKSKEAMGIGTLVHSAIEMHLAGKEPDEILKGNDRAENAYLAFLHWLDTVDFKPIALEKQVIHPTLHYGGTIDCIAEVTL